MVYWPVCCISQRHALVQQSAAKNSDHTQKKHENIPPRKTESLF